MEWFWILLGVAVGAALAMGGVMFWFIHTFKNWWG